MNSTFTADFARAPIRVSRSSAATVVVAGIELSGMSRIVVTPPAAAARVAVSNPSHSVAARIVDVNVSVDDSRHHDQTRLHREHRIRRRHRPTPQRA